MKDERDRIDASRIQVSLYWTDYSVRIEDILFDKDIY